MPETTAHPAPIPEFRLFEDEQADRDLEYVLATQAERFKAKDRKLIRSAYSVARQFHEGQSRKSGEPYITHPVEVARILSELRLDSHTIAAGLMHDVVEDTPVEPEDLLKAFPEPVVELVEGVTKISSLNFHTDREQQVASLRKMMLSMTRDIRVIIVKLCDRLHNMRTLNHLRPEKRISIARDTIEIFAPLADRLGMERIKSELEDLSMRHLHPEAYDHIIQFLDRKQEERERLTSDAIARLEQALADANIEARVTGRNKQIHSIYRKMTQGKRPLDEIYDLIGLRVIAEDVGACYAAMGTVHGLWPAINSRFKDYISMPKQNGYQSIHTTVVGVGGHVIEIQIRTEEMHRHNEEGIAAHWKYKQGESGTAELDNKLKWLRRLINWLTEIEDPDDFLDSLKEEVAIESIFCFTPKGDVIEAPRGATPVDFAFAVHTQVGLTCTGARVNGRIMPLRTPLKNADMVEVLTSQNGKPSADWLEFVKTSKARNKIRGWLKEEHYHENVGAGKEALQRALRERGFSESMAVALQNLKPMLKDFHKNSVDDLLLEIGAGNMSATSVADSLAPHQQEQKPRAPRLRGGKSGIVVPGAPGAEARSANCCDPIPGDNIVGYVTIGRGVTVHRADCDTLAALLASGESGRQIPVEWDMHDLPSVQAHLRVLANDRPGLLRDISTVFFDHNLSIISNKTTTGRYHIATLVFEVEIQDKQQIIGIIPQIENILGVVKVDQIGFKQIAS